MLIVAQPIKTFPVFYSIQMFINRVENVPLQDPILSHIHLVHILTP